MNVISMLTQAAGDPHCLLALLEAAAYAALAVASRFWHAHLWISYAILTILQMVAGALHAGLLATGHG